MTLSEWEELTGELTSRYNDNVRYIANRDFPLKPKLWHLSDYIVSSVSGGAIWLIKRETESRG